MNQRQRNEFRDFCDDHIDHFDAVPCEFESSDGTVFDRDQCWETYHLIRHQLKKIPTHLQDVLTLR